MTIPTTPGIIRRLAALCVLAVTAFGLSVPAASAGTDESITTKRGSASFNDKDEIVTANYKLKDGIGIQAFVFWKTKKGTVSATVISTATAPTTARTPRTSGFARARR